jgi:hypothetical protein
MPRNVAGNFAPNLIAKQNPKGTADPCGIGV